MSRTAPPVTPNPSTGARGVATPAPGAKHAGGGSTKNQKKQKEASQVNTIAKERTVILGWWGSRAAEG